MAPLRRRFFVAVGFGVAKLISAAVSACAPGGGESSKYALTTGAQAGALRKLPTGPAEPIRRSGWGHTMAMWSGWNHIATVNNAYNAFQPAGHALLSVRQGQLTNPQAQPVPSGLPPGMSGVR
jgi:hypothetical protein